MHSQLSFFLVAVLISGPSAALAASNSTDPHFTLQVASFPDTNQAERYAVGLVSAGENPAFDTVQIEGRGFWTRVFVGRFNTTDSARLYGVSLVTRGIIKEFLVKKADSVLALSRPRRVIPVNSAFANRPVSSGLLASSKPAGYDSPLSNVVMATVIRAEKLPDAARALPQTFPADPDRLTLPIADLAMIRQSRSIDTSLIPRPEPVGLAFKLVTGDARNTPGTAGQRGGLWVSGDTVEALKRLQWIAGEENTGSIRLDADGRVRFDMNLLAKAAGLAEARVQDPLRAVEYISSNEGLLLLVQVAQGRHRYLLHIGRQAPTSGKSVDTSGSINLDNNVDSRINPYRKNGKKLDGERPPQGFDSLIALNPVARWFNLSTNSWVQCGEIVFHELAEAYAKLEFGLDYLDQGSRPGAHTLALMREHRLKLQRPDADIVITTGSNRLLRTEEEIRLFTAEASAGGNQR